NFLRWGSFIFEPPSRFTSFDHLVGAAGYLYVFAPPDRRTVNTEPLPCSLVTVTSPPIRRASLRVMARPSPVPPKRCAVVASAWVNSSNSLACCRCHADPGVGHGKLDPLLTVGDPPRPQRDLALLGELKGIAQQIEQYLPQPHGVDGEGAEVVLRFDQQ